MEVNDILHGTRWHVHTSFKPVISSEEKLLERFETSVEVIVAEIQSQGVYVPQSSFHLFIFRILL